MQSGIFDLKTPSDLLEKMRHDFRRIQGTTGDQYAVFDFFVTAEHMVDWVYPDSRKDREELRDSSSLLSLCSHIANGSKHFEARAKHHKSLSDSQVHHGAFSNGFSSDFDISGVLLFLDGDARKDFGEVIYAHDLAGKVLDYWEQRLTSTQTA